MVTPTRIALLEETICKAANITHEELRGFVRKDEFWLARATVWYIAIIHLGYTNKCLSILYARDHTTVGSGVQRIKELKVGEKLTEKVRAKCPEIFEKDFMDEARKLEQWKFD